MEYLTFSAYFHLFLPVRLCLPLAYRPINEPAHLSHPKLPRRTISPVVYRTLSNIPAILFLILGPQLGKQKQDLSLDIDGDFSPPLLKALDGLQRRTQQLG